MEREIDLTRSAANFVLFLKRNILKSVLLVVFTSSAVFYIFTSGQKSKRAEITVLSSKVPFQFIEYIFRPVKTYINNGDYESVSEKLGLDVETTQNVGSIGIEKIEGLVDVDFKNGFTITLKGNNPEALESVGIECVNFLNANEFIMEWKNVYTENLKELEETASEQISRLDSVQRMIPELLHQKSRGSAENANFDIGTIYEQMISLKDHREEIVRELKFNRDFKVISTTFYPVNRIGNKILVISIILINIFVLLIFFYVSIFVENMKNHMEE